MALFACKVGGAEGSAVNTLTAVHPTPTQFNFPYTYTNNTGKTQIIYVSGSQYNEYSDNSAGFDYTTNGNVLSGYELSGRMSAANQGRDLTGMQTYTKKVAQGSAFNLYATIELANGQYFTVEHSGSSKECQFVIVH